MAGHPLAPGLTDHRSLTPNYDCPNYDCPGPRAPRPASAPACERPGPRLPRPATALAYERRPGPTAARQGNGRP